MDHAVSLVQAYLQLNGYFTSTEFPIVEESTGRRAFRVVTDVDVLAFRFPGGSTGIVQDGPLGVGVAQPDPGLAIPEDCVDMLIGEVKEGRVNFNLSATDPKVLAVVLARLGCQQSDSTHLVEGLRTRGAARTASGYQVRLLAFGTMPPGDEVPPCRIISLGHVLKYLQQYVGENWEMLRQCQFKDPALGFLMTLEKARKGGAGRRGKGGVEVVAGPGDAQPNGQEGRRRGDRPTAEMLEPASAIPSTPRGTKKKVAGGR